MKRVDPFAPQAHLMDQLADLGAAGRWDEAFAVRLKTAAAASDPGARAQNLVAAATIARVELGDPARAVEPLLQALEANPADRAPLDVVEEIHRTLDDDEGWVRSLRRVAELSAKRDDRALAPLSIQAWDHLAEVYLTRFGKRDEGADALEQAAALDPQNATRREVLLELWARPPARPERAAAQHRALFALDPTRVDSLRALLAHHYNVGEKDGSLACASALVFLKRAEPDVVTLRDKLKPRVPKAPSRALTPDEWRRGVLQAEGTNTVAAVFALLATPVAAMYRVDLRDRLSADDHIDCRTTPLAFARRLVAAANGLGVPVPEVYRWKGGRGIEFLHAGTPVLLAGEDLLAGRDEAAQLFVVGRHLTYLRPECWLLRVLRSQLPTLRAIFLGSLQVAVPGMELGLEDARLVEPIRPRLEKALGPALRQRIAAYLPKLSDRGVIDLERFTATAESAANRAGLLLAGDLASAIGALVQEAPLSSTPVEEQAKRLVGYSVSAPYLELRAALGMAIS